VINLSNAGDEDTVMICILDIGSGPGTLAIPFASQLK
jgi:hypothetical protein